MYIFEESNIEDIDVIYKLYTEAMKEEWCTWDDSYPTREIIENDISRNDSFVVIDKNNNNNIVAAISIDQDEVVEKMKCWSEKLEPSREVSRVVVREDYRGKGITSILINGVIEVLKKRNNKGIHYLVSPHNKNAIRAYEKMKFTMCGTANEYGHDWLCFEKEI